MEIDQLVENLPSSASENEIADALRAASSDDAEKTLFAILSASDPSVRLAGLRIVRRVVRSKDLATRILRVGLDRGDAYEIRFWLQAVSPIIGIKAALNAVADYAEEHPGNVVRMWQEVAALCRAAPPGEASLGHIIETIDRNSSQLDDAQKSFWQSSKGASPSH